MCGIAGILSLNPSKRVDPDRVARMCDAIRHRGPDDTGVWTQGPVALGSRRLSIVDVAGGHQPMTSEDQSLCIAYNGEIYNHPLLRAELESLGHRYSTRSDTETILHLYEERGDACLEKLRGMFAFGLWDAAAKRLLLARDRLGIKPLYYAVTDRELVFASEIKAILASGALGAELEVSVLPELLATGYVAGEETLFRGVRKLLPGSVLTYSPEEGLEIRRWWKLAVVKSGEPADIDVEAVRLREWLTESVRIHLMSDVPVGVFLSGGLDSSAIACLMGRMVKDPIHTFSVGFDDPRANELAYARLVARSIGAEHREVVVSPEGFFRAVPRLIWHEDEPIAFPSSVPLYFVSRLAREHVKVVLTGEGADELFLGYNRYRITAWNEKLAPLYGGLVPRPVRRAVKGLLSSLPAKLRRLAGRTFLTLSPERRDLVFENFAVFPEALQRSLLRDRGLVEARDPYAETTRIYEEATGGELERLWQADIASYLVELLMKQDQMSMAASVESRVPFLDHPLVEQVASLPDSLKLRGWQTKRVLRRALRDLVPREILSRRKMGFPVPIASWFRGSHAPWIRELVLSERAARRGLFHPSVVRRLVEEHQARVWNHADRLWLLANLEIWQRVFLDGESLGSLNERVSMRWAA
jgi:asparagine synthase (glutamine-hydrolysing)